MKNILWLTEWFPTRLDLYNGDGIERRAKASSIYNNIFVIYVKKDPALPFGKLCSEERTYNENCKAVIYYYPSIRKYSRFLDILLSNFYFFRLHFRAFRDYKKNYGIPSGIQVNVTMKNGIIALYYKWRWHINYIVVEGWSLFLPEEKPGFKDKGWLFRFLTQQILKKASLLVTVSKHLGEMMCRDVINIPFKVVPSTVDKTIFFPANEQYAGQVFRLIHISNLARPKNIVQILLALKEVLVRRYRVELIIYGCFDDDIQQKVVQLGLERNLVLKNLASQPDIANSIRCSDALVLFSLYETFGNVIIESLACGVPVITSNYPVFSETVENKINGVIANGTDAPALAEAIIYFIENKEIFNRTEISKKAIQQYSFEQIGKMLDQIYNAYFPA